MAGTVAWIRDRGTIGRSIDGDFIGVRRTAYLLHKRSNFRESLWTKTFDESDITIETLDAHLRDSGVVPYDVQPDVIRLRTENGIAYCVFLIPDRKFIRFAAYLPLNRQAPVEQKHELARRLNEDVFLPVLTIDFDGDLAVSYVLPFGGGFIAGNFISIVNSFASLLEFVVETYNSDGLIDFNAPNAVPAVADTVLGSTDGEVLH